MASYRTMKSGSTRVLIRRKTLGSLCKTFKTADEAHRWAEAEEARMLRQVLEEPAGAAIGITLREAWEHYQRSPDFKKKAPSTRRRETQAAVPVLRHMGGLSMMAINRARAQYYVDERCTEKNPRGEDLAGDTIYREKELLSALFRWAIIRGYATVNPTKMGLAMPKCNIREARISVEQESKLYDAAFDYIEPKGAGHPPNPNLFTWFQFVMLTGTRPGEAAKIELEWVNMKGKEIRIPRMSHKTRRPRIILLTEATARMVKLQLEYAKGEGSHYLFFSRGKGGFKPYAYAKPWRAICKRAGVPDSVKPHSARHELISRLFERTDLSDSQVAMLVGDVHPLSLKPYTHLRANRLRPKLAEFEAVMDEIKGKQYQQEKAEREAKDLLTKLTKSK
jgi:integrase